MADGTFYDTAHADLAAEEIRAPEGGRLVDGKPYMVAADGSLVPLSAVKPADLLQDEAVRKIMAFARPLSAQIARFKAHTLADIADLLALLQQEYGAKPGGRKGNLTLFSFDGLLKVQLQVADNVVFGPELQIAKGLVDECLRDWTSDSRAEIRAVVERAFNTDKEGLVNQAELYRLLRLEIEDGRWQRAMKAIRDSMRVVGTKQYVRFYERASAEAAWEAITIDLAAA